MVRPQVDHIGRDTAYHCGYCGHHHCLDCPTCHRCGCEQYKANQNEKKSAKKNNVNVIRVFPRRTSFTPIGDDVFIGDPPMMRPLADEVHISVTFTWDVKRARQLVSAWRQYYDVVNIGGPAIDPQLNGGFTPGQYVRQGVTFTSRGCNYDCPWCLVHQREGSHRELLIQAGNIIQDNSFLQGSKSHKDKAIDMLRKERQIHFSGGLEADLIDGYFVDQLKSLRIAQIFLACDTKYDLRALKRAGGLLKELSHNQKRCYVLIGFNRESPDEAIERLEAVWNAGFMPFAQLYQPPDRFIKWDYHWRQIQRNWSRPAIMRTLMKVGAHG